MLLRQGTQPLDFGMSVRPDIQSIKTTGKMGEVIPIFVGPVFRGDSGSGYADIQVEAAEMPKPIANMLIMRAQSWVVPRPALPRFESTAEYAHSYQETDITKEGVAARTPPALFDTVGTGAIAAAQSSEFFRALGISLQASTAVNTDYVDAYILIHNFRKASYSKSLTRSDYYGENATTALELKPAFWPVVMSHVVPDYEQELVKGSLELDVIAGSIPVKGIGTNTTGTTAGDINVRESDGNDVTYGERVIGADIQLEIDADGASGGRPTIYAAMAGQAIGTSLADIDMARKTNAFAKYRATLAGTNYSGYNNDDVIVAELMQGFKVPEELFNRPFLLDSKTTALGFTERHATDAANLDDSSTTSNGKLRLSLNIPRMEWGGVYVTTCEVVTERLYPRQSDEYLYCTTPDDLPNSLRDSQVTEPVSVTLNRQIDALHSTPSGTYGYEPLNHKWKRNFTRLGGDFRETTPGTPQSTSRIAVYQPDIVDAVYADDHFLCPHPFPQHVFSAPSSDALTITASQDLSFMGITVFGEMISEDNSDFTDVSTET